MSGVVSPVATVSSGVVTPSVPIEAARCPAMRHSWRVISTQEVLPLVPVTATTVSGTGVKNRAARRANARRGSEAAMWMAPSTRASGRATMATAPAATAAGMKSSPLTLAPWKAPNTVPGATLRLSIAKPVTCASPPQDSPPGSAMSAAWASAASLIPRLRRGSGGPVRKCRCRASRRASRRPAARCAAPRG